MITSGAPFRIERRTGSAFALSSQVEDLALVVNDEFGPNDQTLLEALVTATSCMFPDMWPSAAKVVDFPASPDPAILSLAEAIGRSLARADYAKMVEREEK